ncbi:hypothetical protein FKP32DRAFT_1610888 [Trametes sanguinea]|nr:hypothetical protein FKP32DRAFT_1610888 [Trametes sanguinea]
MADPKSQPGLLDPALVATTLTSPPFVSVEGVFNIRDFGAGYGTSRGPARIKPLRLFRSADLARITDAGIARLRTLGIRKVFDLRTDVEIAQYRSADKVIEGVEVVRAPIVHDPWDPREVGKKLKEFAEDELQTFLTEYRTLLLSATSSLEQVLRHLRDHPDIPCLIHCSVGKDRTGVFAAIILMLLGARDENIVADYALSEIGMQPALPLLLDRFQSMPTFRDNWAGTVNMGSSRPETMQAFLDMVRREFGGVEAYLAKYTSITEDDMRRIRNNYLVSNPNTERTSRC